MRWQAVFSLVLAWAPGAIGFAAEPVVPGIRDDFEPAFAGQVLLSELNCTACHAAGGIPHKGAPDLANAGGRIHADYLAKFIADPGTIKPGTTMPNVLAGLPGPERERVAKAMADYLRSQGSGEFKIDPIDPEAADRGEELFQKVGCAACHSPKGTDLPNSPPLTGIDQKYSLSSLTEFLEDPLAVRPGGRMPDLQLDHWEAADLASYLLRGQELEAADSKETPGAAEGEVLFQKHGCANCHAPTKAKPDLAKPLAELDAEQSCSKAAAGLSSKQESQIAAAIQAQARFQGGDREAEREVQLSMARLNCIACHQRGEFGGHVAERDSLFTTTNLNLGEQARVPPALTHVGAKLSPRALRKTLVGGESVRPYMTTRMPRFGAAQVEPLIELFGQDRLPAAEITRVGNEKEAREAGVLLAGDKNLSCVACHTFNGESATTLAGIEMTIMAERLRENWFHLYLRNPQQFHPTTIMPGFWPGGKPVRPEILDGDTGKQIDALWQYLSRGREARRPSGIRREPIVVGPTNGEAIMLRRQYNGIGKRGIGVGYPAGINLAFDAAQLRLGTIWKGEFGEMSGVWRGQGSGNVGERSRDVIRFPSGPAFALLDSPAGEWPVLEKAEKAPGFQLKGYTLDRKQRPTFEYTFAGLTITDAFVDRVEGPSLERRFTFNKAAPESLYFRVAADKELKVDTGNGIGLPRGLGISLDADLEIRDAGEVKEALVRLGGRKSLTIHYKFAAP